MRTEDESIYASSATDGQQEQLAAKLNEVMARTRAHTALLDWLELVTGTRDGHDGRIVAAMTNLRKRCAGVSPRCSCQWGAGDSPCPIHREEEEGVNNLDERKIMAESLRRVGNHDAAAYHEAVIAQQGITVLRGPPFRQVAHTKWCSSAWGENCCDLPKGHDGLHHDETNGNRWTAECEGTW